jgi:hypothetical protein
MMSQKSSRACGSAARAIVLAAQCDLRDRQLSECRVALANLLEVVSQLPSGIWQNAEHDSGIYHSYKVASRLIN